MERRLPARCPKGRQRNSLENTGENFNQGSPHLKAVSSYVRRAGQSQHGRARPEKGPGGLLLLGGYTQTPVLGTDKRGSSLPHRKKTIRQRIKGGMSRRNVRLAHQDVRGKKKRKRQTPRERPPVEVGGRSPTRHRYNHGKLSRKSPLRHRDPL